MIKKRLKTVSDLVALASEYASEIKEAVSEIVESPLDIMKTASELEIVLESTEIDPAIEEAISEN